MSIKALPPPTVRIIGSAQVLTDPASVVKELIDNALDARATSVFVEISANTLDVIQVRDNGHGIAPDDRALLCKRYCTSKIKDYGDLKELGGKWLGFRGEALASAAELSSSVLVTTKVESEGVAVTLKINNRGEIEKQDRASHPVGTTVRVNDIFKFLPVRKQTALKAATKTLGKIKRLLQTYALARPATRFSLRVLKAKNDKSNWMYVPSNNAGIEDAVVKVVGHDCASQCDWTVLETNGFEVEAFIPRPDAASSKISNVGSFVFVDSRPVSTTRGTLKQISSMFKERLRSSSASLDAVKDPFGLLNINCPPGSYDPNVEPAKDDVMFEDNAMVVDAVEKLLDQVYPRSEQLGEEVQESLPEELLTDAPDTMAGNTSGPEQHHFQSTMYGGNDENPQCLYDTDLAHENPGEDDIESTSDLRDISLSNPWVVAKMNASNRPRRNTSSRNGQLVTPLQERTISGANSTSATEAVFFPPHHPVSLPTPAPSSPLRGAFGSLQRPSEHVDLSFDDVSVAPSTGVENVMQLHDPMEEPFATIPKRPRWKGWIAINDFLPAGQLPLGTPFLDPSSNIDEDHASSPTRPAAQRRKQHAVDHPLNKPFVSPVRDDSHVWFDSADVTSNTDKPPPRKKRRSDYADVNLQEVFAAAEDAGRGSGQRRPRRRSVPEVDEDDIDGNEEANANQTSSTTQATIHAFFPSARHFASEEGQDHDTNIQYFDHDPIDTSLTPPVVFKPSSSTSIEVHQQLSGYTDGIHEEPLEHPASINDAAASPKRTRTGRSNRALSRGVSRSAHLPFEHVPTGFETHNLTAFIALSIGTMEKSLRQFLDCDECRPLREGSAGTDGAKAWGVQAYVDCANEKEEPALRDTGFSNALGPSEEDYWLGRLRVQLRSQQPTPSNEGDMAILELRSALADALKSGQTPETMA